MAFWTILATALLVALDQAAKHLALALKDMPGKTYKLWEGVLHLSYVENRGAAFGFFQGQMALFYITTAILFAGIAWAFWKIRPMPPLLRISLIAILAGGIGNLIDRIRLGYVIDFLEIKLFTFPVFNVADMLVSCGMVLLCIYIFFFHDARFPNGLSGAQTALKEVKDIKAGE
ncbi:MAG: signal peptidase II [Christensenellales bacterium]|jgi:signal peptidase II